MSLDLTLWMSCGVLSLLLPAVGTTDCTEGKGSLLGEIPSTITQPTDCLMECTALTFSRKLQLGDNRNIRLKDSTEDLGEYCWPMDLKCTIGEHLQHAFVVLPVATSVVGHEQLTVNTIAPTVGVLRADDSPTTLANNCGLRYEATQIFKTESTGASLCVQIVTREDVSRDGIFRCPPFLVTIWQPNPNKSKR